MEEIVVCPCAFKTVKSTLYKTQGRCPKCNKLLSKTIQSEMTDEVQ